MAHPHGDIPWGKIAIGVAVAVGIALLVSQC